MAGFVNFWRSAASVGGSQCVELRRASTALLIDLVPLRHVRTNEVGLYSAWRSGGA